MQAIAHQSERTRSLLFLWLADEPEDHNEYFEVASSLMAVDERNLAQVVVQRGLALFPESEQLSLYALKLEFEHSMRPAA